MAPNNYSHLYLHFPFCETKCHYCDFYSLAAARVKPNEPARFELALRKEVSLWARTPEADNAPNSTPQIGPEIQTIFMGGGTPSMTPPEAMARAIEPLWSHSRLADDYEWTMEANPSSVTKQKLRDYQKMGINRISMGVQAMNDELLARLGRVHSRDEATRALEAIFDSGFDNVSVDLLCGVPGQSKADLTRAIDELVSFPITHLSCYLLTLPKKHRMHPKLPDENEQLGHLLLIHNKMIEAGFEHYEISNFARTGKRARHNLNYWGGDSYLGLGPSAHSFDRTRKKRWKNYSSLHLYGKALLEEFKKPLEWEESLTPQQEDLEKWMLALRLDTGFSEHWLTHPNPRRKADYLVQRGLLEQHPTVSGHLRLTPRGFALSDQVIGALV